MHAEASEQLAADANGGDNGLSTSGLVGLTAGKTITNVGLRWISFFLPELGSALSASTTQMTTVLGVGEGAGLFAVVAGRRLDRGGERSVMTTGMGLVALSTAFAITGSFALFAVAHFLLLLGIALYTVGGHAYISRRVPFSRRGRAIGIFEISWAIGLLVGAPVAALLIDGVSWRAPFIAVGILSFTACALLLRIPEPVAEGTADSTQTRVPLNRRANLTIAASAGISLAGLTTIVIAGTWMNEALGVDTGGVGLVAMCLGFVELSASGSSASFSDRLGKTRSTSAALVVLCGGLAVMGAAGSSLLVGALGLFLFFSGFEYAIVTSFSIVSEAMPEGRGRVLAANTAVGTLARGVGTIASGFLYEWAGITGPAVLSAIGALSALLFLNLAGND